MPCRLKPELHTLPGGPRRAGSVDHVPEFRVLLERAIFAERKARTKKKILERVPVKDAMDDEAEIVAFEIDPIVSDSKAVKGFAFTFKMSEFLEIGSHFMGQSAKFAENMELEFLGHAAQFRGTGRIKNDLEWPHDQIMDGNW